MSQYAPTYADYQGTTLAQRTFMTKVYGWMSLGLIITSIVSLAVAQSQAMQQLIFKNPAVWWILIIAQFGLVIAISAGLTRIPASIATLLFMLYSALMGLTLSVVLLVFTRQSVFGTFAATAGMFACISAYGYVTKKDLSSWGSILFMALIGLVIASVVNWFLANSALYWVITYAGILIFVGLTAYDTQKIKNMYTVGQDGSAIAQQYAIAGALRLYIDFINLFLLLLRLFGRER